MTYPFQKLDKSLKLGLTDKTMNKLIGYARVSTDEQNSNLQIDALLLAGCTKNNIYKDKVSGAKTERPGLTQCLNNLINGDVLVVWRLDRLGRSMVHLVSLVEQLRIKGIGFKSICDGAIDTTTASGELVFNIFSSMAQLERRLIQERTQAGLSAARARGRKGGRPKVNPSKIQVAKNMHQNKSLSIEEICKVLTISKPTLYRYLAS